MLKNTEEPPSHSIPFIKNNLLSHQTKQNIETID